MHIEKVFICDYKCRALTKFRAPLFILQFNCFVERCSKSSCTLCTPQFLRSIRLALDPLMTINRGAF